MKKIILITGASSGMGLETAKKLVREGHVVYGAARHIDKIREAGAKAIEMDISKFDTIKKGVDKIIAEQGRIDVLWNNAGFGLYGPVEDISLEKAKYQFEVNLFGLARLTQLVTPYMRKQKSGLIINTSSIGGKIYFPLGAWYHATKHALEGFSDCLRLELKEFGINVVVLEPGMIETRFGAVIQKNFPQQSANGPYQRLVNAMMKASQSDSMKGDHPSVISHAVSKIIRTDKPKTRYLVGKMAKPLVFMRKFFGDRFYDNMIMKQFGK